MPAITKNVLPSIKRLHVVFKTHLDIGFTDLAGNVVALYMDNFLPRALSLAEETRRHGRPERFVWTVGAWLIWQFLERKGSAERRRMEKAIEHGDIAWHALPFTMHSELIDASLFKHGLTLSQRLDQRFGRRTIAAKATDVPGHTRAIIPLLADAGVKLLHIGVNPASALPCVPPVFRWRSPDGAELMVIYSGNYGKTTTLPELDHGLSICFTGDNLGPQSTTDVDAVYTQLRARHPTAQPVGSTLDAFARKLETVRASLPVIEAEIGDTWIHGIGTDPAKVAGLRALMRLRRQWIEVEGQSPLERGLDRFSQKLLLVAEHTWGLDIKKCLGTEPGEDRVYDRDFKPEVFRAKRHFPNYRRMEASWIEQRNYLHQAVESLGDAFRVAQARTTLDSIIAKPPRPRASGWKSLGLNQLLSNDRYEFGFDRATGAINHLIHRSPKVQLATPAQPLAQFRYDLYSSSDYAFLWKNYIRDKRQVRWWAEQDFTKPGLADIMPRSKHWFPQVEGIYWRSAQGLLSCQVELRAEEEAEHFGCPRRMLLTVSTSDFDSALRINFQWFGKAANRLPEAMWLGFNPPRIHPPKVRLRKLGQWIDPRHVVKNGARHLHAIEDKIRLGQKINKHIDLETLDTPLAALGKPALVRFTNRMPALHDGVWFNLHNNVWGTNFPLWYEENGCSRFRVTVGADSAIGKTS